MAGNRPRGSPSIDPPVFDLSLRARSKLIPILFQPAQNRKPPQTQNRERSRREFGQQIGQSDEQALGDETGFVALSNGEVGKGLVLLGESEALA